MVHGGGVRRGGEKEQKGGLHVKINYGAKDLDGGTGGTRLNQDFFEYVQVVGEL